MGGGDHFPSESYYNLTNLDINEKTEEALSDFIHHSQTLLLQSIIHENTLVLHTKIQYNKNKSLIFYKSSAQELSSDDSVNNINLMTLTNNAAESLYQILKQIYSPLLTNGNDLFSNKIQKNISDLETNLRIINNGKTKENVNLIFSIEDEVEYWKSIAEKKDASKKEKDVASSFLDLFEDISEEIRLMQTSTLSEIRESTENIGGILDDVWRLTTIPYSEEKMIHVLNIIGHEICSIIQKTLSSGDMWEVHDGTKENEILISLSDSLSIIQTWISASKSLTETYWPNYALHAWPGNVYVPTFCINLEKRLKEIHEIRSTYSQLNKLLTKSEKEELNIQHLFESFKNINIWIYNGPNQAWESAMSRFSLNLRPAESKIAEKLKPRLHNTSTKQMLYEFIRYKALIDRPLVKRALNNELEIFVRSLLSMLKSIKSQMDSDDIDVQMYQPPEMSLLIQQVQWAKQTEAKVKDIRTSIEKYLIDFDGSTEVITLADLLLKDLKTMYTQLYDDWSRELQAQIKSGSLQLSADKPVVEFSGASKLMVVQFDARVIRVEKEARALSALGLPPPPAAAALAKLTDALTHAQRLHQVASFHNTLAERMVPSTRGMMLQAALGLSSLVQEQRAVYWTDAEQLAAYTDKLVKAVLNLEAQNSYLTNQHIAIRNIIEQLVDTELLAQQSEWKKKVKDVRDIIEKVEAKGYKNTDSWKLHWDWQLYKALECQYIKTLLSLHKYFPHFKVDLVLRGHEVRLQPPLEEVRMQHYHQLRRLVALPAQFVGLQTNVGNSQTIFANIVHKHSWLGNKAVEQLERTLKSLEQSCAEWTRRAALACVPDLTALCAEQLREPAHWEINFKACKAYGQAVAKMTFDDEKIEWISVGTASLRREFEAQTRSLWACLMSSLQTSCRNDSLAVDEFIANAQVMLDNNAVPKNAKDLSEISAKQQALQKNMPEMERIVEELKQKSHMLRTWGGDTNSEGTIKEWQKTREKMLSHQQMFEHQADIVKSSLIGEWENLNTSVEAWASRWSQNKTRLEETRDVQYTEMADRCRSVFEAHDQWEKFVVNRNELLKECDKFSLTLPPSEVWQDADSLMKEYTNIWTVLKEYIEDYESILCQEWIVFQKKLHLLDEFVSKWTAKLEPYTVITLYMQQELDKYLDLTPLLKYLRGTEFTERHWREVFGLLEMEYKKPDTLQVKDFLVVAVNIKKQIKALQKICTTATSEAAIRNALNELELWFAGARLNITYYNDKSKRVTPVVKDFKDILSKIEEQQWIVSSLSGGDSCASWESRLRAARVCLKAAAHAQRRWLYLEPILSNDEGELGAKFRKVDLGFRQVTRTFEADPRLSALLQSTRLQPMLDSISEQLHACQSSLNLYIDEKRSIFPRLYFLSDDDLLELLGQARAGAEGREAVMQTHLKKLFPGINGVRLGPGGMSITALCSHHDNTLQLDHPVDIDCPVEIWLKCLENEMRSSLKNMTLKCVGVNSMREQDPFTLPTQILCLAQNIRFTEHTEKAITTKELHKLKDNIVKENASYATTETEDESDRYKRQSLMLQCAHYISVIQILIKNNVVSSQDWHWQKQLRFYLQNKNEVVAKMGLATIPYSYEYLGVDTGQFVRTELADECFLILTQSLYLGMVGNPFGPAGTGKTESVKALGGLVGRLVLIFNCDEAMDVECMGRLLSGLALCGAWGCFDEFNRLSAATLAAVSHPLSSLLAAMQPANGTERPCAILNGKPIRVSEWCGVAATMNPIGRGYGGRRALPAALERVLRPVSMSHPGGQDLAARLLAARAIDNADEIAGDLYDVFSLASHLLSEQRHYDWGLRALKSAVGSCGAALAARAHAHLRAQQQVVRRVLRLNNVSKLTSDDAGRFEHILSLVFADVPEEENEKDPISNALESAFKSLNLISNEFQVQKCMELYEQLQQRMGVVVVGPPGSGKTTIRQLLKCALTIHGKNIVEYVISPKAMSRSCLLGRINHDTRQWTDGVISATALEISNQPTDVWSWIVCDGDIDPEWIESLNSVLDDNRLLTLPSGWRIQFGSNVNFIFETHSLEHASPATISRLGIILLSEDISCAHEVLSNWLQNVDLTNDALKVAVPLLQQATTRFMKWFQTNRQDAFVKINDVSMVKHLITQFEYIIHDITTNATIKSSEEMVSLAIEWSLLGILKEDSVDSLHEALSEVVGPARAAPAAGEWLSDTLYLSPRLAACERAVRACAHNSHLLLIGPCASAKNLLIEHVLKEVNCTVITIDCTPMLEPSDIIAELKRNNAVRAGGGGNGSGGSVVLVIRGVHRAAVDGWRCSTLHQFLLQLIQHGGLWGGGEEGGVGWWRAPRLRVLATAAAPLATPRLAAALAHLQLGDPDDEELHEIATNYLKESVGRQFPEKDIVGIATNMLSIYKEVSETFYSRPHYKWTANHLKRWCENIKWYAPSNNEELITAVSAEANVIFKDRLISEEEKGRLITISRSYLKNNPSINTCYSTKLKADGVYLEAVEYNEWCSKTQKLINQCLTEDENVFGETGVEVSKELATLCSVIARVCAGSYAVCVGSAGVGRRAATHIVAAALPATAFFVNEHQQFTSIVKNAVTSASEGARTVLFVCEPAVTVDVLSSLEAIHRANSIHAFPTHIMPTQNSNYTLDNIKQYLGIVICLDKDQENLWDLMEKYPYLHSGCQFVWLEGWTSDTLRQMPPLVIDRLIKENVTDTSKEELKTIPVEAFVKIHESLEAGWQRAPCRYINFVKTYFYILKRKKQNLTQRQNMLSAGVEALRRARSEVATLQQEAAVQETALRDKQDAANKALEQIAATVRANTTQREEMTALKAAIQAENETLQIRKKEIEAELATVEPVIAAARAAVGDIRPESLSEIRSLRAPPDVVRDVLEGVLRLMGIADTSWHSMKNFLSKRGVKEDIRCLDASQISPEAVESVERLLKSRGSSFEQAAARRASAACAPLAAWVRANLAHAAATARVQPLQHQQAQLHRSLRSAEEQVSALSSGLASVEERVAALQQQLGAHSRDAAALELRLAAAEQTIAAATALLRALAAEDRAWEADLEHISKEILQLNHRSLLAAAYIVYLSDITEPQAKEYLMQWSALIGFEDKSFSVLNFLSSTETQLKWHAEGLPSDTTAIKNAVLIDQVLQSQKCGFTPLIIDPDGDAVMWLKNTLSDTQCDFVPQYSNKLVTAVQYAARLNRLVVITEVDTVRPGWLSGRLVLVARRPPTLSPPAAARLSRLYFAAGVHALTDQLVHYALQQLQPEVSENFKGNKLKKATLQKQQHELQENLLSVLSTNSDILHDGNVLSSLNKTRETSATIAEALEAARGIERDIESASEAYRPGAERTALLALTVKWLSSHRPLIALPIDVVLDVFVDALSRGDHSNINNDELIKYITRKIIERVLLGLHKKDKYIIVLHILKQVYDDFMPDALWQLFLGNFVSHEDQRTVDEIKKTFKWIPDDSFKKVAQLKVANEEFFNKLSLPNTELWKEIMKTEDLKIFSQLNLTRFETVVAVSALRPDFTYRAVVALVDDILGGNVMGSGNGGGADAVSAAARWTARGRRPALLLAAHAQDVLAARAAQLAVPLRHVGVEEGLQSWQEAVEGARGGSWVALIVGASPFTQQLQNFIIDFVQRPLDDYNEEFRLWILCEDREIPPVIANACVNVILEAPEGVKHNVTSTLCAWGAVRGSGLAVRTRVCLALFHAIVQERRAYIPQGWSRWYAWEWGEVSACADIVSSEAEGARALVLALYAARAQRADRRALAALHRAALADHARAHGWRPAGLPLRLPAPSTAHLQPYISAFDDLPNTDPPQLLGLPENCRIAWERNTANDIITGLKELGSTVEIIKRDKNNVTPLKMILALWKKLMSGSELLKADFEAKVDVRPAAAEDGAWWAGVCACEAASAARAARRIHRALAGLARARHAAAPLHQTPEEWQEWWSGPADCATYLREFCHRARAALARLPHAYTMPTEVDLRTFLSPARVVWALRAADARRLRRPARRLRLLVTWDPAPGERSSGLVVSGLELAGGAWAGALRPPAAADPPRAPAPPLLLTHAHQEQVPLEPEGAAEVPVFASAAREQLVFAARAPLARDYSADALHMHAVALIVAPVD